MKQIDYGFAKTLLVIALLSGVIIIGFLWWDNGQTNYGNITNRNQNNQPATFQISPTPIETKKETLESIEADLNKIDSTQYEKDVDLGLTQLGTNTSAF